MTYVDETSTSVYGQRIKGLGEQNAESLEVSFLHLADSKPIISYFLANCPATMLALFDTVALDVVKLYYPDYDRIHSEIHVRITELPTAFTLRELRHIHLDALVRVSGVVTRRTGVFPQLKEVKFDCGKCGEVLGPFFQDATTEVRISFCSSCQAKGPFTINSEQVCAQRSDSADRVDRLPQLPAHDAAGVARLGPGWSSAAAPRGHPAVGPDRLGQARRGDCASITTGLG